VFVELDRDFVPLEANRAYRLEELEAFSLFGSRQLKWTDLLAEDRVVVLASAASGKSEEFRNRAKEIRLRGDFALYSPIERIAEHGLGAAINVADRAAFADWQRGAAPGWFFLDSIDEARINHKDVEAALNRFAAELGDGGYRRARIFLSCRGSVWEGDRDTALIARTLPRLSTEEEVPIADELSEEALFAKPENRTRVQSKGDRERPPLKLVSLARISQAQRGAFLTSFGFAETERFEADLFAHGLDALAQRPGDLKLIARYWSEHRRFGSLTEMTEFGVIERLAESSPARRRATLVSDQAARQAVERLAAAMTLAHTLDLRLTTDDGGDSEGIDPHRVLADWTPKDVDALLQRGVFVPSTFGRLRFYHRSAQEYLTACWFNRLRPGLTDPEILRIFLSDPFGVRTVPSALRASAAWIAATHPLLRAALLDREPLVLLTEGDPSQLTLSERQTLLRTFAARQQTGEAPHRLIDHRALWMFADSALAPVIAEVLESNRRADFRFEMLRLIEAGPVRGCEAIVRAAGLNRAANPYERIVATRALKALDDAKGLAAVAADLLSDPTPPAATFAPTVLAELFPTTLTVSQLVAIIAKTRAAREFQVEGYREELAIYFESCATKADRQALLAGLAELVFEPPLDEWPHVSKRHRRLAEHLGHLLRVAIAASDTDGISPALLTLLRAAGFAGDKDRTDGPALEGLVRARMPLLEALFRADLRAAAAESDKPVATLHDASPHSPPLWTMEAADRPWLESLIKSGDSTERRVALDILFRLAWNAHDCEAELDTLARRVAGYPELAAQLFGARSPRAPTPAEMDREARWAEIEDRRASRETAKRESLLKLRDRLLDAPEQLSDPAILAKWPGPHPLLSLTHWLAERADGGHAGAATNWRLLIPAFGQEVADHYRRGMMTLWRVTPPERPRLSKGQRQIKYTIILSHAGLALEAAEDRAWATRLSPELARRAAEHVALDDQSFPDWLPDLLAAHTPVVGPIFAAMIRLEWRDSGDFTPLLERAAHRLPLPEPLRSAIMAAVGGREPPSIKRIATAAELVLRLSLTADECRRLARLSERRLFAARNRGDWEASLAYLRLLFRLDVEPGAAALDAMLAVEMRKRSHSRATQLLRALFNRHHGSVVDPTRLGPARLKMLTEIAYRLRERSPRSTKHADDAEEEGRPSIDDPRDALLSALISLNGEEAYRAVLALATSPHVDASAHRLRELAREIAERAADRPPWHPEQVIRFEADRMAPIATGDDLFSLVGDLLEEIDWSFSHGDMSARAVVESAQNEEAVQQWLGRTLETMSGGRFVCHRESQVAGAKRPDLIVTATSAPVEVAIEIKHGDKGWTFPGLRAALRHQLAEQYLQPDRRRHGFLVVTHHRSSRFWRDNASQRRIGFSEVIGRLAREATDLTANSSGAVRVGARGLDAAPG
jgi:hypothetical protein